MRRYPDEFWFQVLTAAKDSSGMTSLRQVIMACSCGPDAPIRAIYRLGWAKPLHGSRFYTWSGPDRIDSRAVTEFRFAMDNPSVSDSKIVFEATTALQADNETRATEQAHAPKQVEVRHLGPVAVVVPAREPGPLDQLGAWMHGVDTELRRIAELAEKSTDLSTDEILIRLSVIDLNVTAMYELVSELDDKVSKLESSVSSLSALVPAMGSGRAVPSHKPAMPTRHYRIAIVGCTPSQGEHIRSKVNTAYGDLPAPEIEIYASSTSSPIPVSAFSRNLDAIVFMPWIFRATSDNFEKLGVPTMRVRGISRAVQACTDTAWIKK